MQALASKRLSVATRICPRGKCKTDGKEWYEQEEEECLCKICDLSVAPFHGRCLVFGRVVKGLSMLEAIEKLFTFRGVPARAVTIAECGVFLPTAPVQAEADAVAGGGGGGGKAKPKADEASKGAKGGKEGWHQN